MSLLHLDKSKWQYVCVLVSNALVILLGFVFNIIVTHIMTTDEYGYYKAFVNSLATMTTLFSFGFSLTFSRLFAMTEEKKERKKLFGIALFLNLLISIIVVGIISTFNFLLNIFNFNLPQYILVASFFVFVPLIERMIVFKLQGENRMLLYSLVSLIPKILLTASCLVAFCLKITVSAGFLCCSYLLSSVCSILAVSISETPTLKFAFTDAKVVAQDNFRYGFHLYIGSLASVASAQILNLMVASISGLSEYAMFSLGITLATPIMQIPSVMGTIGFKSNIKLVKLPRKQILFTFFVTIIACIFYGLLLNIAFSTIIGEFYHDALFYATIMILYYALMGLGDYFNRFILAKGEGKMVRNSSFVVGILLALCAAILIPSLNVTGVIIAEFISAAVYLINMVIIYVRVVKKSNI